MIVFGCSCALIEQDPFQKTNIGERMPSQKEGIACQLTTSSLGPRPFEPGILAYGCIKVEAGGHSEQYEMDLKGMKVGRSEIRISVSKGLWQKRDVDLFVPVEVF